MEQVLGTELPQDASVFVLTVRHLSRKNLLLANSMDANNNELPKLSRVSFPSIL